MLAISCLTSRLIRAVFSQLSLGAAGHSCLVALRSSGRGAVIVSRGFVVVSCVLGGLC